MVALASSLAFEQTGSAEDVEKANNFPLDLRENSGTKVIRKIDILQTLVQ